jgi:hypothetical protein
VLKNFFRLEVLLFCLRLWFCLGFWMVFWALFTFTLWCVSTFFAVRFNIVCGALSGLRQVFVCSIAVMCGVAFVRVGGHGV